MKRKFEEWYLGEIMKQLDGKDIEFAELQPIKLGMHVLKELGVKGMVEMAEYFGENPQIVVSGFMKAGIAGALDGQSFYYNFHLSKLLIFTVCTDCEAEIK